MFIFSDSFALLNTKVSRISVSHVAITHQRMCSNHAMDVGVGCGSCDRMRIAASGINIGMDFHSEIPLVAFSRPDFSKGNRRNLMEHQE